MKMDKCHEICFRDVPNDWDSALPVGNGRMGAMVFVQDHVLHIAVNHYDCYYHVLPGLHGKQAHRGQTFQDPARFVETYEELCRRADAVRKEADAARSHYARTLHPVQGTGRPAYRGASYPQGGEVLLALDERVDLHHSSLRLRIEEAVVIFEAGTGEERVSAEILAAREEDGVLIRFTQTRDGLWKDVSLVNAEAVGAGPCRTEYITEERGLCMCTVYGGGDREPGFLQELSFDIKKEDGSAGRRDGCGIAADPDKKESLKFGGAGNRFTAALSLLPGTGKARTLSRQLLEDADAARRLHHAFWKQFWSAGVSLPDEFLEHLWYLQVYLLECSCGRGSAYPEQSWGLSGLWDIRRPNMWGSMWYWDVNIQSSFWGISCAGHPEILKLFCDGYMEYEQDIREYTRRVYGAEGWALDYPHPLYHCIQPWCAQFLWQYYQYSGDRAFLERKAYPVFREQIAFFRRLAERDGQGILHVRYDISPEQGPVTMDSVITISCVGKLIAMAIEAGKVLNRPAGEIEEMEALLRDLPPWPLTGDGSRYKDSLLAEDNIFLRHPSILMPLFPAEQEGMASGGDAGRNTEAENIKRWEHTLQYAAEHTETGTFGMGWLAAAAARLGRGRTALRLIYEKGLDYFLHTNGLAYEESERFLNYCHLTKPAHYLPVMMESAGGLINAVNQMLLQTGKNGEIRVFPAIPDETPDLLEKIVQYREDDPAVEGQYDSWEDVGFDGLLAPGGFRISAVRKKGVTVFLKVESSAESQLKLVLPGELADDGRSCMLVRHMKAGEIIFWGEECGEDASNCPPAMEPAALCHTAARTHRRIFLGADRHTGYYQAVDSFTCGYLLANEHRYVQTPYIFDFGTGEGEKDYEDSYPRQFAMAGQCILYAAGPRRIGAEEYLTEKGYGFLQTDGIRAADRGRPDDLRRDLLEGDREAVFALSLPKGKYDLLLICGDEEECSCTMISLPDHGTALSTGKLEAGSYGCRILPVVQERDGELRVRFAAGEGCKWKLNAMFVNKEYGLTVSYHG